MPNKKSVGMRALSAKQREDDNIRAPLKEHLSKIRALIQLDVLVPVEVREGEALMVVGMLRCFAQDTHIMSVCGLPVA